MPLTKKNFLAIIFSAVAIVSTPTIAAGKIENATPAEVKASLDTTIERAEKTLTALESGSDKETVLGLLSDTKQMAKEIHATRRAAVFKGKAGTQMKKARKAAKEGDLETAKKHVAAGVEYYHELKKAFSGN